MSVRRLCRQSAGAPPGAAGCSLSSVPGAATSPPPGTGAASMSSSPPSWDGGAGQPERAARHQ
eukprot:12125035-Karenia_brevis.AAC.1